MSANGRLQPSELTVVQGTITLANATAQSWRALDAACLAATGVDLVISPNGGYRSYATQVKLSGKGHHQYEPGHSVHGYGNCVDIANYSRVGTARLDDLAELHGFRRTIAAEPWHYQHDGTAPAAEQPAAPINQEEEMLFVLKSTGRGEWLIGPNHAHHMSPAEAGQINSLRSVPGQPFGAYPIYDCGTNNAAFDLIKAAHKVQSP